jgi:PAS domain S-box-containing protein
MTTPDAESMEARLRYLEGMHRIHQVLDRNQEAETLLQDCVEALLDLFQADRCILAFPCDPESDVIRIPFLAERQDLGLPPFPREFSPVPEPLRRALAALMERTEPLALGSGEPSAIGPDHLATYRIRSRLTVAIRPNPGPAWNLTLHQCSHEREWTADEQALFRDSAGRIKGVLESLALNRELRRSEEFLHAMTEVMPHMLWASDGEGKVEFVNKRWMDFTGQSWEKSLSDGGMEAVHPRDRQLCRELWDHAMRTGDPYEAELRYLRHDGEAVWHLTRAYPVRDAEGRVIRWIGTCTDISEAKRMREQAERDREQLSTILTGTADAIVALEPDGRMVYANDAAGRLFDLPSGQALLEFARRMWSQGRRDEIEFTDENGAPFPLERVPTRLALQGLDAPPVVLRFRPSGGAQERWVNARATPIFDAGGAVSLVISVTQDITELKAKEAAVRRLEKLESLGKLAGGVAHDFNNMLVTINGYSDLGLQMTADNPVLREFFQEILRSGQRAAALTQQLLAYGRKQMMQPRRINLNAVVGEMQKLLERLIGEEIRLRTTLAPDLPGIQADPSQIEQVIMNLVVNARDAMPHGGTVSLETGTIELGEGRGEARPGPYVTLTVSDTGIGMEDAVMAKAFEPFFTTKEVGAGPSGRTGTGLGLSSVYGTVKQCGGHIEVESAVGRGSTFRIFLPVAEGPAEEAREAGPQASGPEAAEGTILLVEDEDSVRHFTERALAGRGFRILSARDGREAIALAGQTRALDLLLTDVVMPQMRGPELAGHIRQIHPGVRVLFMSGYPSDDPSRASLEGAAFLQKPYRAEELMEKVDALLRVRLASP